MDDNKTTVMTVLGVMVVLISNALIFEKAEL